MIKRILLSLTTLLFLHTVTYANERVFYQSNFSGWNIQGIVEQNKNDACMATYTWQDGSAFSLVKDLADGEWYFIFLNRNWNISDELNLQFNGELVSYSTNGARTYNVGYVLIRKDTVVARNLYSTFLEQFVYSNRFLFVMPGNIPNAQLSLAGTKEVARELYNCMLSYKRKTI